MTEPKVAAPGLLERLIDQLGSTLAPGQLGVVMARAGVGKTSFLIQLAMDESLNRHDVLHLALGQTLEHVQQRYQALFGDLADARGLVNRESVRVDLARHRSVQATTQNILDPRRLRAAFATSREHLDLHPSLVMIDGFDWEAPGVHQSLVAYKQITGELGASLWLSAPVHRDEVGCRLAAIPAPVSRYEKDVDLAISLEPQGAQVGVHLLKAFNQTPPGEVILVLDPNSLLPVVTLAESSAPVSAAACTLLSGAAEGAEAEFGACAEKFGLMEINYSFTGRQVARTRGLTLLGPDDLRQGDVSLAYLESRMHRRYRMVEDFRKVLQTIWHQVSRAKEVFVVGVIQPAGTVKGGTGWAVELAKRQRKPVTVYDQERRRWFEWKEEDWKPVEAPVIRHNFFTGTGTRLLNQDGRQAIHQLFERTFPSIIGCPREGGCGKSGRCGG